MVETNDCLDDDGEHKTIMVSVVVIKYFLSVWEGSKEPKIMP